MCALTHFSVQPYIINTLCVFVFLILSLKDKKTGTSVGQEMKVSSTPTLHTSRTKLTWGRGEESMTVSLVEKAEEPGYL